MPKVLALLFRFILKGFLNKGSAANFPVSHGEDRGYIDRALILNPLSLPTTRVERKVKVNCVNLVFMSG